MAVYDTEWGTLHGQLKMHREGVLDLEGKHRLSVRGELPVLKPLFTLCVPISLTLSN